MLYLEDLHIGDRFISREYEMTAEEIKKFATQYDPQVFHLDEEQASRHPVFQGLAASGWHTSAITHAFMDRVLSGSRRFNWYRNQFTLAQAYQAGRSHSC